MADTDSHAHPSLESWRHRYHGPVTKLWPRRLLDTISMTSFERQDGNVYGDVSEPTYSILSYTWGRFALRKGKATQSDNQNTPPLAASRLPVQDITWKIPAINPRYFHADQFARVISQIRAISGSRFLWVDVACIDQENYGIKMEEVGRQAGIFANAGFAFIWLWTIPTEKLRFSLVDVLDSRWIMDPFASSVAEADAESRLRSLQEAVNTLLDDWWFSSLWTLQEQGLRPDAIILSRDGDATLTAKEFRLHEGEMSSVLGTINRLAAVYTSLEQRAWGEGSLETRTTAERLGRRIRDAGYEIQTAMNPTPHVQFTIARRRQATNELDRIYGIIALYDIQVGATIPGADTTRKYALEELELEFAAALNAKSPFLAQFFLHAERPRPGKTWQITQDVRTPNFLKFWPSFVSCESCSINVSPVGPARITANILPLQDLVSWNAQICKRPGEMQTGEQLIVAVDDYICRPHTAIPYFDLEEYELIEDTLRRTRETVDELLATFQSSRLSVLELGRNEWNSWSTLHFFGLLILHDEEDRNKCQRIGLCRWAGDFWDFPLEIEALRPRFDERYNGVIV